MKDWSSTGRGSVPYFYFEEEKEWRRRQDCWICWGEIEVGLTQSFYDFFEGGRHHI